MAKKYIKAQIELDVDSLTYSSSSSFIPELACEEAALTIRPVPGKLNHGNSINSSSAVSINCHCPGPSTPSSSSSHSIPLDLRTSWKTKDVQLSEDPTVSKLNFLFSDLDPIATQLYLRALQEAQKFARVSGYFPHQLESEPELELEPESQPPVNVHEQRRIRKNVRGQLIRNQEKYRQYWMLVQVHQMEKRNLALNVQVKKLEAEKTALRAVIQRFVGNISTGSR